MNDLNRTTRQSEANARLTWTPHRVRQLGMTTDIETAAAIIGIGRTHAFELIKSDQFPTPVLRLGRRTLIPVGALLQFLGGTCTCPSCEPTQNDRATG